MKRIRILLSVSILCCCLLSIAQSANDYVSQAIKMEQAKNEVAALDKYKKALLIDKNNVEALCGASFMCSRIGNREKDEAKKKAFFNTAKLFAEQALKLNANSSRANYIMAVAMGRMALISGSKDKVAASRDIKKHADLAVKLDPKNSGAWHVLGKYNYEVSNLNFAERGAAKILFGGLPPGDNKTAIKCYEKCKSIDGTYLINLHDLALAYKQDDQLEKAKETLKLAVSLNERFQDDASIKAACQKLLKEWK